MDQVKAGLLACPKRYDTGITGPPHCTPCLGSSSSSLCHGVPAGACFPGKNTVLGVGAQNGDKLGGHSDN